MGELKVKLELDESDLQPNHKDTPTSSITFGKLNEKAQRAVELIGCATFRRPDTGKGDSNYTEVYPNGHGK